MTAMIPPPFPAPPARPKRILVISYDLKTPGRNYAPFYEALKKQGVWWHYLTSTWLISTTKTPKEVQAELGKHLTVQDSILIVTMTSPYQGFLPKAAWEWIQQQGLNPG